MELRDDALLSVGEAAKRLGGISRWTIHAWLSRGLLLRTKVGSRTMIRESELQKVIEDGGKSPAPRRTATVSKSLNLSRAPKRRQPRRLSTVESKSLTT